MGSAVAPVGGSHTAPNIRYGAIRLEPCVVAPESTSRKAPLINRTWPRQPVRRPLGTWSNCTNRDADCSECLVHTRTAQNYEPHDRAESGSHGLTAVRTRGDERRA